MSNEVHGYTTITFNNCDNGFQFSDTQNKSMSDITAEDMPDCHRLNEGSKL